jgi:hypothetical protein
LVNIFLVGLNSTRWPGSPVALRLKKPCRRRPGRLLHVVGHDHDRVVDLSWWMRSSIADVEIGSRAEQGSSISSTSGSTAIARAMHSRCCWPPDRPCRLAETVLDLVPEVGGP